MDGILLWVLLISFDPAASKERYQDLQVYGGASLGECVRKASVYLKAYPNVKDATCHPIGPPSINKKDPGT